MPEKQDVKAESSSALQAAIASSPEVEQEVQSAQETQTPPAQQGVNQEQAEQEEARIPYSRFKEKVDEANWLKQQLEQTIQQNQQNQQFQQPAQDPYAGMTLEEREFWRRQREIAREEALRVSQEQIGQIRPVLDAGRRELAQMRVQQFRAAHPDIKPNSSEETEIAGRINAGYNFEDAYWAVMGPRGIQTQVKQQIKQQIAAKKSANVESSASISTQAQKPEKLSFREEFAKNWQLAEEGKL